MQNSYKIAVWIKLTIPTLKYNTVKGFILKRLVGHLSPNAWFLLLRVSGSPAVTSLQDTPSQVSRVLAAASWGAPWRGSLYPYLPGPFLRVIYLEEKVCF